jgi:putative Mg2+ transporter-C (MgtC) family protein
VSVARDVLYEELERAHYPVRQIEILSDGDDIVELAAALVPTSAQPEDLDAIIESLCRHDGIASATWTVSTMA